MMDPSAAMDAAKRREVMMTRSTDTRTANAREPEAGGPAHTWMIVLPAATCALAAVVALAVEFVF